MIFYNHLIKSGCNWQGNVFIINFTKVDVFCLSKPDLLISAACVQNIAGKIEFRIHLFIQVEHDNTVKIFKVI